ncbi:hypothetical protein [Vibrio vulnificus]|uniref:hypothetical protein n=1 Tax=Vibrio vulnificus TaxID=672 RepID=UPI001FAF17FD|nr:hypothetical protein [Vibrio vulnificus]MCJ0813261.1 hypothetical protein [Vibrio vulnificus]
MMPFILYPIIGAAAGFGAGYFTGSTTKKLVMGAALVGGGYLVYKHAVKGA